MLVGSIFAVVLGVVATLYFQAYYASDAQRDVGAYEVSRIVWGIFLVLNIALGYLSRKFIREALERRWLAGIGLRKILIAGAGDLGRVVADRILEHRELGYQIVGFVDDKAGGDHLGYRGLPLLGSLSDAAAIVNNEKIDDLYVALPLEEHMKLLDLVESTSREGVDVKVVPDLLQFIALRARLEDLDGVPVINLNDVPLQGISAFIKRVLDVVISFGALAFMALPGLVISWMIKRSSPGPIFYSQERMGLDGKQFTVYKFRTMPIDAESDTGPIWADENDNRAHAHRRVPAPPRSRRVAAVLERAGRRHVDRRTAAGAAVLRRAVQAPHPAVHAAPQGQGRHHRLGAGQRLARQHLARKANRVRPVLHRELVGDARHQDHVAHADSRVCPQPRLSHRQ